MGDKHNLTFTNACLEKLYLLKTENSFTLTCTIIDVHSFPGAELLPSCPSYQATFLKGISRVVLSLVGNPPAPETPYEDQVRDQSPGQMSHSLANRNRLAGLSPVSSQEMPLLKTSSTSQSQAIPHRFTGSSKSEDLDMSVVPSKPSMMAGTELPHNDLHSSEGQGKTTQSKHFLNSLEVYPKQLILDLEADGELYSFRLTT